MASLDALEQRFGGNLSFCVDRAPNEQGLKQNDPGIGLDPTVLFRLFPNIPRRFGFATSAYSSLAPIDGSTFCASPTILGRLCRNFLWKINLHEDYYKKRSLC